MASFRGKQFRERGDGTWFSQHESKADVTIHRIPGGNRVVVQTSGQVEQSLPTTIRVTAAELQALRSEVGAAPGTLSYSGGVYQAMLISISNVREARDFGIYFCDVSFLVLA